MVVVVDEPEGAVVVEEGAVVVDDVELLLHAARPSAATARHPDSTSGHVVVRLLRSRYRGAVLIPRRYGAGRGCDQSRSTQSAATFAWRHGSDPRPGPGRGRYTNAAGSLRSRASGRQSAVPAALRVGSVLLGEPHEHA